jgi:hypothetical protein
VHFISLDNFFRLSHVMPEAKKVEKILSDFFKKNGVDFAIPSRKRSLNADCVSGNGAKSPRVFIFKVEGGQNAFKGLLLVSNI